MNIEIVTIGDELLLGFTVDTNGVWLARELAALGVSIVRRTTVGDDPSAIQAAVGEALARTGAVITTGGLGPTADDRTRPAIAALFGRSLHFDEGIWQDLCELWRRRGRPGGPPPANRQQAMVPDGAEILRNRHGTAPGLLLTDQDGRWVAMIPGVPREMRGLFADEVLPRLRARAGESNRVVRSRTLRTTGIAESQIADMMGDHADGFPRVSLAYLPGPEGVDLRLTVRDVTPDEADTLLSEAAATLRPVLGRALYGEERADLAAIVIDLCRARSLRVAVAESCTGGMLGQRLTSVPGSSEVMLGGVIAYDNGVKRSLLGVEESTLRDHGAVSKPVVVEMAAGVRARLGADIGVGITGVAGPGGGTPDKPVGHVWLAVNLAGRERTHVSNFTGDRDEIRFRATQAALDMIRRGLSEPD